MRAFRWMLVVPVLFLVSGTAFAQNVGTPAEAKAMLEKVVAAIKADKTKALDAINKGAYKDRDLYPFCGGPDGNFTAHGNNVSLVGQSMKDRKDSAGTAYGAEFYTVAKEGSFAEVPYMYAKPGDTTPVQKVSYITKVGDQVCGVGYYK
jgi:signal transduction histidine kinase